MKDTTIHIRNMDCEDEAGLARRELGRLGGVAHFDINIMSRIVHVSHDPSVVTGADIAIVLRKAGLDASLPGTAAPAPEAHGPWWRETRILTLSACGVLILSSLLAEHVAGLSHSSVRIIYAAAVAVGGYYPAKMGLSALKSLSPNIRTLMVAGAAGAVALGLWEEAALLVLIYSLGDILEAYAADRVRGAVRALVGLAPKEALVRRGDTETFVPLAEVAVGDTVVIRPGERIPLDGKVISGATSVDQAPVTGESMPVAKGPGDEVFAGSLNQRGSLEVSVAKLFDDTTLGRIIHYVEEAETRKSSYQRFGETFGRYYTPSMFVLVVAVMTGPPLVTGGWGDWFYRGLVVLVVSCSCGIALSIPVSVVAAVSNAARHGVLVKGGAYLEAAARVRAVAFDKTGSLTAGRPVVTDVIPFGGMTPEEVLSIAASLESRSEHVLAEAVLSEARRRGATAGPVHGFEAVPGMGARGTVNGGRYCIGSVALCRGEVVTPEAREMMEGLEGEGKTLIVLAGDDSLAGIIAARDELRPEAAETVSRLKDMGLALVMLTGDNRKVAEAIAARAGIADFSAGLLPEEKVRAVKVLKERYGHTAMVGDGVNDAPAMISSDLGVAMGAAGTDVAVETGDVVLMSDDLTKIPYAVELGRRTVRNMKQNICVSLAIIGFLVPMALLGWIGLVPGLLINEVGGLVVIMNGLRLLR